MTTTILIVFLLKATAILALWIGHRRGKAAGVLSEQQLLLPKLQEVETHLALASQTNEHQKQINELQSKETAQMREDLLRQALVLRDEISNTGRDLLTAKNKIAELEAISLKDKEILDAERKQFEDLRVRFKQEFENLANRIFENKQTAFNTQSRDGLNALLLPFKEQLESFRVRVDQVHTENVQGQTTLKTELDRLQKLNQQVTQEASNLTRALKGDKKLQGNWGEQKVELLLEQSGLRKGEEYEREKNFKDNEGNNFRPDFVVKLPDGKHIIIDSKVSLVDYSAFIASETTEDRKRHLVAHIVAIRNHIKALSEKRYPNLVDMDSPDFTFLFVAIEPAYVAALEHTPTLFQEAYDQRIALVTATTLLPVLRVVANLWVLQRRDKSTQELATQAGRVYDKLCVFLGKMEQLGKQLDNSQKLFRETMSTLKDGKGNLISTAEKLQELGAKTTKKMPQTLQGDGQDDVEVLVDGD